MAYNTEFFGTDTTFILTKMRARETPLNSYFAWASPLRGPI